VHGLLLCLFFNSFVTPSGNGRSGIEPGTTGCFQALAPVTVIADGNSDWAGESANKIVGRLTSQIGACNPVQLRRFDAEPAFQTGFSGDNDFPDLILVKPQIPMRDVIEEALASLVVSPHPRTVVVIAHAQTRPTTVSTDRLLELARQAGATIHTIHLARRPGEPSVLKHFTRSVKWGVSKLSQDLGMAETGYSAPDTARLLKLLANGTGGTACEATAQAAQLTCADAVADALSRRKP